MTERDPRIDRRDELLATDGSSVEHLPSDGTLSAGRDREADPLAAFDETVRAEDVPPDVREMIRSEVDDPDVGFFGPDSVTWRINRENVLYLGGVTPILLQIGHPKVAAGLRDHSTLQADYYTRLRHTFDVVDAILFGDVEAAVEAAVVVRRVHERVTGTLDEAVGRFDSDDAYYANDPELLLWVGATLFDLSVRTYEAFVGDLSPDERSRYYREHALFQRLVGTPPESLPDDLDRFEEYYRRTIGERIRLGPSGRDVAEGFLAQFGRWRPVAEFLGAALMPDSARERFGFEWDRSRQRRFRALARAVRAVPLRVLPDRIRYRTQYRAFDRV